jgi:hypothetical protein
VVVWQPSIFPGGMSILDLTCGTVLIERRDLQIIHPLPRWISRPSLPGRMASRDKQDLNLCVLHISLHFFRAVKVRSELITGFPEGMMNFTPDGQPEKPL